ncbi:MAG: hypothetical protein JW999_04780 [Methanotrichaceae archaeon]|nr:hypothetical protein [Methanotrichaceae archaeon]
MRYSIQKSLLFLCILCLGISLSGTVAAQSDQTYGAYPGAPTTAIGQPVATVGAYPTQPTPTSYPPTTPTTPIPTPTTPSTVVGAYPGTMSSAGTVTALYYVQAPPVTQQNVLLTYNIQTAPPTAVYYSGSYMPWTSFYQVFPANSPALWVSSSAGWSWYATCPVGSWVQELIYVPVTGAMKLYELHPDGTTTYQNYGFTSPGYKYRWFYAATPGRYIDMITVSDNPSNYLTIDVA